MQINWKRLEVDLRFQRKSLHDEQRRALDAPLLFCRMTACFLSASTRRLQSHSLQIRLPASAFAYCAFLSGAGKYQAHLASGLFSFFLFNISRCTLPVCFLLCGEGIYSGLTLADFIYNTHLLRGAYCRGAPRTSCWGLFPLVYKELQRLAFNEAKNIF